MHKAQITITNAIQSSVSDNFNDLVFIDPDDVAWVTSQGVTISPDRIGPELILEYDGPVSNIDAAQFEAILCRVKFDSFDTQKNCDRRITVVVWDSPLKRMSNVITAQAATARKTRGAHSILRPSRQPQQNRRLPKRQRKLQRLLRWKQSL